MCRTACAWYNNCTIAPVCGKSDPPQHFDIGYWQVDSGHGFLLDDEDDVWRLSKLLGYVCYLLLLSYFTDDISICNKVYCEETAGHILTVPAKDDTVAEN